MFVAMEFLFNEPLCNEPLQMPDTTSIYTFYFEILSILNV